MASPLEENATLCLVKNIKYDELEDEKEWYDLVRQSLKELAPHIRSNIYDIPVLLKIYCTSIESLTRVVDLIYEKALDTPFSSEDYIEMYADLCKYCERHMARPTAKEGSLGQNYTLKHILVNKCRIRSQLYSSELYLVKRRLQDAVKNYKGPEEKKVLWISHNFKEQETRIGRRAISQVRFLSKLYLLEILPDTVIQSLIGHLLFPPEPKAIECLCVLLTNIESSSKNQSIVKPYFKRISDLATEESGVEVSMKIKSKLANLLRKFDSNTGCTPIFNNTVKSQNRRLLESSLQKELQRIDERKQINLAFSKHNTNPTQELSGFDNMKKTGVTSLSVASKIGIGSKHELKKSRNELERKWMLKEGSEFDAFL